MIKVLATFYLTYVIHESEVGKPTRLWLAQKGAWWLKLLSCPFCCAFWAGLIIWRLGHYAKPLGYAGGAAAIYTLKGKL